MKVFNYIEKLSLFHHYVLKENTGNAARFAERIEVSRATIYNMIDDLKSFGIDIKYSRSRETYYYKHPDLVKMTLYIRQLCPNELQNTFGGKNMNSFGLINLCKNLIYLWI